MHQGKKFSGKERRIKFFVPGWVFISERMCDLDLTEINRGKQRENEKRQIKTDTETLERDGWYIYLDIYKWG